MAVRPGTSLPSLAADNPRLPVIDRASSPEGRLSAAAAKTAVPAVGLLALPAVVSLGPGAAQALSRHAGTLALPGLRSLAAADARSLGWHRDWLLLDGLEALDSGTAKGLARHRGGLSLRGLATISAATAKALAASPGDLRLDGVLHLDVEAASALAAARGTIHLDGLEAPTLEVLSALARHSGGLSLGGLRRLDPAQATTLASHCGRLRLDGLESLDPPVAQPLGRHRGGLWLGGLRAIGTEVADLLQPADRERLRATGQPASAAMRSGAADVAPPAIPVAAGPDAEPLGVAIIGGGFAGIALAIGLLEAGRKDFLILEKASSLGGTWRDNTYPGCACDVPSRLYSYSFATDAEWSRAYAQQGEILAYIERVARRHDVHRFTRFGTAIERLEWDEAAARWRLSTATGCRFTARAVVSAVGGIHLPHVPALPGLDTFAGPAFHTACWRHDVDLAGRRVAVIGTGASAIQVVPELAGRVEQLTVFQRTPPWILPRRDHPVSPLARWLDRRVPGVRSLRRRWLYWSAEARAIPLARFPRLVVHPQRKAKAFLKKCIEDPRLRRKLVPDYALGCKRVLKSDNYYQAIARDDVELVVEPITRISRWGITTADGIDRPVDALILATGFKPFDLTDAVDVIGREGRALATAWREGPEAFHGLTVAGFPNLFLLMGPNTALGHNSVLVMIEAQVRYILQCLDWLARGECGTVEVTQAAQASFNATLRERFARSVWRSGSLVGSGGLTVAPCGSWYVHPSGRNHVIWPGTAASYCAAVRRAERGHFLMDEVHPPTPVGHSAASSRSA